MPRPDWTRPGLGMAQSLQIFPRRIFMIFREAIKKIFSLGLPMAGTQLIHVSSGFLCMTMLAKLGHDVLFSLSVLVSHANGAKNYFSIGNYVQQGWLMAVLISIPIIVFFWNIKAILILLGQSPQIASIVQTFFRAFVWGVIPNLLSTCNQQFGYGLHKKSLIVTASLLGIIVLLISSYTLIFGKFGFPKLGVAGLGYAQAIQFSFFFIFTTLFYYFDKSFAQYKLFQFRVHKHLDHFVQMFKIGGPICAQMGGEIMSLFVMGIMVGWIGSSALAASQIVNQYYFLAIIPLFVFSQAGGILVGQANGAKEFHEIKLLGYSSIAVVVIISLFVTLVFTLLPTHLASVYINIHDPQNKTILHYALILFYISAFTQLFDGTRNMLIGVMRGLFDTKIPMVLGLILIWAIELPLCYILAFTFNLGIMGIALGALFSMIIGAGVMFYRWHSLCKNYA
jgi:MATE family multidrug resistance protein